MSLPAGLLASVMGGQPLTSMLSLPCALCLADRHDSITPADDQPSTAVTIVAGTLVCDWHGAELAAGQRYLLALGRVSDSPGYRVAVEDQAHTDEAAK